MALILCVWMVEIGKKETEINSGNHVSHPIGYKKRCKEGSNRECVSEVEQNVTLLLV